jgi:hypothetical protein
MGLESGTIIFNIYPTLWTTSCDNLVHQYSRQQSSLKHAISVIYWNYGFSKSTALDSIELWATRQQVVTFSTTVRLLHGFPGNQEYTWSATYARMRDGNRDLLGTNCSEILRPIAVIFLYAVLCRLQLSPKRTVDIIIETVTNVRSRGRQPDSESSPSFSLAMALFRFETLTIVSTDEIGVGNPGKNYRQGFVIICALTLQC